MKNNWTLGNYLNDALLKIAGMRKSRRGRLMSEFSNRRQLHRAEVKPIVLLIVMFSSFRIPAQTIVDAGNGEHWIRDQKGCLQRNEEPKKGERVTWSGGCKDGYAEGFGVQRWNLSDDEWEETHRGTLHHGEWDGISLSCSAAGCSESQYRRGMRLGQMTSKSSDDKNWVVCSELKVPSGECNGAALKLHPTSDCSPELMKACLPNCKDEDFKKCAVIQGLDVGTMRSSIWNGAGGYGNSKTQFEMNRCVYHATDANNYYCMKSTPEDDRQLQESVGALSLEAQGKLLLDDFVHALGKKDFLGALDKLLEYRALGLTTPPAVEVAAAKCAHAVGLDLRAQLEILFYFGQVKQDDKHYGEALELYRVARDAVLTLKH
jgi:hypothetical protein